MGPASSSARKMRHTDDARHCPFLPYYPAAGPHKHTHPDRNYSSPRFRRVDSYRSAPPCPDSWSSPDAIPSSRAAGSAVPPRVVDTPRHRADPIHFYRFPPNKLPHSSQQWAGVGQLYFSCVGHPPVPIAESQPWKPYDRHSYAMGTRPPLRVV